MKTVRRGWQEEDERFFSSEEMEKLSLSAYECAFLLERGYPLQSAVTFTANHRLLSQRQRIAMGRITVCPSRLRMRKAREMDHLDPGCTVHIDALNAVILMETALSHSVILQCMDGCIRDLSGLAGTYSIISVTDEAITRVLKKLTQLGASKAVFWIDSPVSNSGRLKQHIADCADRLQFPVDLQMVHNADTELKKLDHVISGDSEIIEQCKSWFNLYPLLINDIEDPWIVHLDPH